MPEHTTLHVGIKLGQRIIEQQNRWAADSILDWASFRQAERQNQ
jgi:hypothetical protein